jgi:hypothetical protein
MEQPRTGLNALKARVKTRGLDAIDKRTSSARALLRWKAELAEALGGSENLSPQKAALVDLAVRLRLFLDHVDGWLLERKFLINTRKKSVIPALLQRQTLADSLARTLNHLGLERVPKPVPSLQEWIAKKDAERKDSPVEVVE